MYIVNIRRSATRKKIPLLFVLFDTIALESNVMHQYNLSLIFNYYFWFEKQIN